MTNCKGLMGTRDMQAIGSHRSDGEGSYRYTSDEDRTE
jgi:hypothetical protein